MHALAFTQCQTEFQFSPLREGRQQYFTELVL